MEDRILRVFIVDNNKKRALSLRRYLRRTFQKSLDVSVYFNEKSSLAVMNTTPHVIVLNFYLNDKEYTGERGMNLLQVMKGRYPESQILLMSSDEAIAQAIQEARSGVPDYVIGGETRWYKLSLLLNRYITQPVRIFVAELGVPQFIRVFFFTFFVMGLLVFLALKFYSLT
ncbi:MAG TPA: hypothetical protein VGO45_08105 [Bacteroidia bacterium]|jgi:DNA-binding NtrC family response regulator|nr:hypothetical protein [Bacteroidia bacterium]